MLAVVLKGRPTQRAIVSRPCVFDPDASSEPVDREDRHRGRSPYRRKAVGKLSTDPQWTCSVAPGRSDLCSRHCPEAVRP